MSDPRIDPPLAALAARPGEAEACAAAGQSLTPAVASPDKPKRAFGTESNLRVCEELVPESAEKNQPEC